MKFEKLISKIVNYKKKKIKKIVLKKIDFQKIQCWKIEFQLHSCHGNSTYEDICIIQIYGTYVYRDWELLLKAFYEDLQKNDKMSPKVADNKIFKQNCK